MSSTSGTAAIRADGPLAVHRSVAAIRCGRRIGPAVPGRGVSGRDVASGVGSSITFATHANPRHPPLERLLRPPDWNPTMGAAQVPEACAD